MPCPSPSQGRGYPSSQQKNSQISLFGQRFTTVCRPPFHLRRISLRIHWGNVILLYFWWPSVPMSVVPWQYAPNQYRDGKAGQNYWSNFLRYEMQYLYSIKFSNQKGWLTVCSHHRHLTVDGRETVREGRSNETYLHLFCRRSNIELWGRRGCLWKAWYDNQ